jgi:Bacterial Ig-like domain (group 3)
VIDLKGEDGIMTIIDQAGSWKIRSGKGRGGRGARPVAELLESRQLLAVITVNSIGDADGADGGTTLSLRQAIEISNGTLAISALSISQDALVSGALSTPNTIDFAIAGTGPFVIEPSTALPAITSPVVIDGYSQAGAHPNTNGPGQAKNTVIQIELDGAMASGANGLDIQAGDSTVQGLAIGGFSGGAGILLEMQTGDLIQGDFIGTDASGTSSLPNAGGIQDTHRYTEPTGSFIPVVYAGSNTIGGTAAGAGNVISGNLGVGLDLAGVFLLLGDNATVTDLVEGNFIGTDVTGSRALFNLGGGINDAGGGPSTIGGTAAGAGNVISGNTGTGLVISGYFVGGSGPGPAMVFDSQDLVQGNLIGTDVTGSRPLPNAVDGIQAGGAGITIGGTTAGAGNVISGNSSNGLAIANGSGGAVNGVTSVLIEGNRIGTDLEGTGPLPNAGAGILVYNSSGYDTIGGTAAGAANIIADNGGAGVTIDSGIATAFPPRFLISGNSIYANGNLGINYFPVPATDFAAAPPAIQSVTASGAGSLIIGTVSGYPSSTYTVEFFSNVTPDPSGAGQGQTYLGSITYTTDATGNATFDFLSASPLLGQYVSATSTLTNTPNQLGALGVNASTSEFAHDALGYSAPTVTTVTTPGVAPYGQPVTLTASVAPTARGIPTGQVAFLENGIQIGTATLDASGVATFDASSLSPGFYNIQAAYRGDGNNGLSASTPVGLSIRSVATSTTVTGPSGTTPIGQAVTLTATVPATVLGAPTGFVQFSSDGVILGISPLQPSGIATFTTSDLGVGSHVIVAAYLGDLFNTASQSSPIIVTVGAVATSTTLAGPSGLALVGKPITYTAIVQSTAGIPSGLVAFAQNGVLLGTATLNASGVATLVTTSLGFGSHAVTAAYLGNAFYASSLGGTVIVGVLNTVTKGGPAVTSVVSTNLNTVTIAFSLPMMVGASQDPANYAIVGPDGKAVAIESAEYDPAHDSVILTTEHALKARSKYKIKVEGQRAGGVADVAGTRLAGKRGRPGTNYAGTFKTASAPHAAKQPEVKKASTAHKAKH